MYYTPLRKVIILCNFDLKPLIKASQFEPASRCAYSLPSTQAVWKKAAVSGSLRVGALFVREWENGEQEAESRVYVLGLHRTLGSSWGEPPPLKGWNNVETIIQVRTLDKNRPGKALSSSCYLECPAPHLTLMGLLSTLKDQVNNCLARKPFLICLFSPPSPSPPLVHTQNSAWHPQ